MDFTFTSVEVSTYYEARVPNLEQQRAREWRGRCPIHHGKNDNFAVSAETGRAFCHSRCGRGWDILGLEQTLSGTNFKTAKSEVFRLVGRPEREQSGTPILAQRRADLERNMRDIALWHLARIAGLEVVKADAVQRRDDAALESSAREQNRIQSDGVAVVALYRAHVARDPLGAAKLIAWARNDERHAETITAAIVFQLAAAEVRE